MVTPRLLVVAEVRLVYITKVKASDRPSIKTSVDARDIFIEYWDSLTIEHCEEFKMLLLNRSNRVLGLVNLFRGGISGTVTDVRIMFQAALKAHASSIILAHNHPSGNTEPSDSDRKITDKIKRAGELMDIQLLDHLVIIPGGDYYSLADNGII